MRTTLLQDFTEIISVSPSQFSKKLSVTCVLELNSQCCEMPILIISSAIGSQWQTPIKIIMVYRMKIFPASIII
ncbi:MAG: hypothetical protein WDM90_04525 [Ferruginibacter sp.]